MSFTNLITTAIDSVADEILSQPNPSVCELGNQRLKNSIPLVSFVGYTNAGKSTLFNAFPNKKTAFPIFFHLSSD